MNLTEAAHVLGISPRTLRLAVERGEIAADHPLAEGPWLFKRCDLEAPAVAALVARVRRRGREGTIPSVEQGTFGFSPTSTT
jgi:Helix-turn-helix domain